MRSPETLFVFLVDDDPLFQKAMKEYLLQKLKYRIRVRIFSTGEECLKYLHQKPDLILLDYFLKLDSGVVRNGMDALTHIRAAHPEVPVVMLSANANLEMAVEAIKSGAYDFIAKNETVFTRVEKLAEEAIQSVSFFAEAGNCHFWIRKKNAASRDLSLSLKARSHIFFSPIELPDNTTKNLVLPVKRKRKPRLRLVH
jgi:DNA-binding NtrC family response regulator